MTSEVLAVPVKTFRCQENTCTDVVQKNLKMIDNFNEIWIS